MATEMGAIIILIPPSDEIIRFSESVTGKKIDKIVADNDATYEISETIDISSFVPMASRPGKPHDSVDIEMVKKVKIDSGFIGSCTNGRIEDMQATAAVLKDRKIAPGVVLKIVPATDEVWNHCLEKGYIEIFKSAGALVSNAGCAGCAAGQVGQNGPGEITISTGNRNFPGKQGKGEVYISSPANVAASAIAGYITTQDDIPNEPAKFDVGEKIKRIEKAQESDKQIEEKQTIVEGRAWYIKEDNIDTDMIFHNRYLSITDIDEMGQYAFDNLEGYEDFAKKAQKNDIIFTLKNFGAGSSRQQAVDCFTSLGVHCVIAESFGAIYERNAINAAFPIMSYNNIDDLELTEGDNVRVNYTTGEITNLKNNKTIKANPFSDVQLEIFQNGGLF